MQLTFHGAAGGVTGSKHLVEIQGRRVLLDCGLFQGRRAETEALNRKLPFEARHIDAVLLSHAHIDHCGNLPTLVKEGFRGRIYATSATRDLAALMLMDSARLQEGDLAFVNRIRRREGQPALAPLYTEADVAPVLKRMVSVEYDTPFEPVPGLWASFRDAGHILGSAIVGLEWGAAGQGRRLVFSGDLGRPGMAILRDPEVFDGADFLILESTYGDRRHNQGSDALVELETQVHAACGKGGVLLIPAFALGRVQELIYRLNQLWEDGRLPPIDVYVDSPLAVDVLQVFRLHPECYDEAMRQAIHEESDHDPLGFRRLHLIRDSADSKRLNSLKRPAVIIAPSGMCEGGRVLHHLRQRVGDPATTLMFVGFQAQHTLGRKLLDGLSPVNVFGQPHTVRARIVRADTYSAHADRDELLAWYDRLTAGGHPRETFLVHGEPAAQEALAAALRDRGAPTVSLPALGEGFELD